MEHSGWKDRWTEGTALVPPNLSETTELSGELQPQLQCVLLCFVKPSLISPSETRFGERFCALHTALARVQ